MDTDEQAEEIPETARRGAVIAARTAELRLRRRQAEQEAAASRPNFEFVGRYLKRSRGLADLTQDGLAAKTGVSQSMISRAERGLAQQMPFERFLSMVRPLERLFPLGRCPHDHECPWQPIRPPQRIVNDSTLFVERMLAFAGET